MNAKLRTYALFAGALGLLTLSVVASRPKTEAPSPVAAVRPAAGAPRVQIALLLDTSSSMNGLLEQAKSQLWKVVNELAQAKRDGRRPELEIALYEYGKPTLGAATGFIRQVLPLTGDLDRVSEELFALTTHGGDEYAGQVIEAAVKGLSWSADPAVLRTIFIAGNEDFEQGPVSSAVAIAQAVKSGITVNTVFCGSAGDPEAQGWRAGALLADGRSLTIDHNQVVAHIAAPQDDEIVRLGSALNETYLGYGEQGGAAVARQAMQDKNAEGQARWGSAVQRSLSKAGAAYQNPTWDLVDAVNTKAVDLEKLGDEALPPALRGKDLAGRQAVLAEMTRKRAEISRRIADLNEARKKHVAEEERKLAANPGSLDLAMLGAIREQASKKGFRFE